MNHVPTRKHLLTYIAGYSVIFKLEDTPNDNNPQGARNWGFGFVDIYIKYKILSITKAS